MYELEVNSQAMQSLQDAFCKSNDMYVTCIGKNHGQITSFSGTKSEEDFACCNFTEALRKEIINSFVDGSPENIVERAGTEDYFMYRGVAIRDDEGVVFGVWLCLGIDKEKLPASVELPAGIMTTTPERFDKGIGLLEILSKHYFNEMLRNYGLKQQLIHEKDNENEIENRLKKNQIMVDILRLMESEDSFAKVAESILVLSGKYIECTNMALVQMSVDGQTADMILEWTDTDKEIKQDFQSISITELPFMNGKPYTISSDASLPESFKGFFDRYNLKGAILLPLTVNDSAAMYLCFMSIDRERQWSVEDIRFANDVKNILHTILTKKITANSLAGSYSALEAILQNAGYGVVVADMSQKQILYRNDTFQEMFDNQIDRVAVEDLIFDQRYSISELNGYSANGSGKWFDITSATIKWVDAREVRLITFYDTTDIRNYQKKAEKHAQEDSLTGLYNRQACEKDISMEYHVATKLGKEFAVLMFDIDDFTNLNQGMGYRVADDLLEYIAHSINEISYIKDRCYRIGGDEFAVLVDHENIQNLDLIIKRIMNLFDNPWVLNNKEYSCTISMGGIKAPEGIADSADILTRLTIALHGTKDKGHNSFQFYNEDAGVVVAETKQLEQDLKRAVDNECKEFLVYYQPIMEFVSGVPNCCGAEALIRWDSPERGMVMPGDFIGEADRLKLIGDIGLHVLMEAAKTCKHWNDFGHPEYTISVNVAASQLIKRDFINNLDKAIKTTAIDPKNLTLEVTDASSLVELDKIAEVLDTARALGCRVALDDFDLNSSFNQLKKLPIDTVKINKGFASKIATDNFAQSFVKTVSELANSINVEVCIEGVEQDKQLNILGEYPVKLAQGFYFDKPLSKEEFGKKYI